MSMSQLSTSDRKRQQSRQTRRTGKLEASHGLASYHASDEEDTTPLFITDAQLRRKQILDGSDPQTGMRYQNVKQFNEAVAAIEPLSREESEVAHNTWFDFEYGAMVWADYVIDDKSRIDTDSLAA
jgi:hypothetical protein